MKKGCIIAVVVVLVLGALAIGGCVFLAAKNANSMIVLGIEASIAAYRQANPTAQVEATNEAWSKALESFTPPGGNAQGLPRVNGKLVDMYQNPVKIVQNPDGSIAVFSAGKDGQMDTADDEGSGKLGEMMKKAAEQK